MESQSASSASPVVATATTAVTSASPQIFINAIPENITASDILKALEAASVAKPTEVNLLASKINKSQNGLLSFADKEHADKLLKQGELALEGGVSVKLSAYNPNLHNHEEETQESIEQKIVLKFLKLEVTEENIRSALSQYGTVISIDIQPQQSVSFQSKSAFVKMGSHDQCEEVMINSKSAVIKNLFNDKAHISPFISKDEVDSLRQVISNNKKSLQKKQQVQFFSDTSNGSQQQPQQEQPQVPTAQFPSQYMFWPNNMMIDPSQIPNLGGFFPGFMNFPSNNQYGGRRNNYSTNHEAAGSHNSRNRQQYQHQQQPETQQHNGYNNRNKRNPLSQGQQKDQQQQHQRQQNKQSSHHQYPRQQHKNTTTTHEPKLTQDKMLEAVKNDSAAFENIVKKALYKVTKQEMTAKHPSQVKEDLNTVVEILSNLEVLEHAEIIELIFNKETLSSRIVEALELIAESKKEETGKTE